MKKFFISLCLICIIALSCGLTACGSTTAKITGLCASVGTEQMNPFDYDNPLLNDETLTNDDYTLRVGQNYLLGVAYAQRGGSKLNWLNADIITLKYDSEVLELIPPDEKYETGESKWDEVINYTLTCKKAVVNTAIIVEVSEYTCTVIISAE